MSYNKYFMILVLTILLIGSINALEKLDPLEIDVIEKASEVQQGGEAIFILKIKNNQNFEESVQIGYDELNIYPFSDSVRNIIVKPSQITLEPAETKEVKVSIRLLDSATVNRIHITNLKIKSLVSNVNVNVDLNTFVIATQDVIVIVPKIQRDIIPGRNTPFKVSFKNRENVDLENLEIYLTSEVFSDSRILSFAPNQAKEEDFVFDLDPSTKAGEYLLNIRIYKNQVLQGAYSASFFVSENTDVGDKRDELNGFLSKTFTIITSNDGNLAVKRRVTHEVNFFDRLFTSTNPKGKFEDGMYIWEFTIDPSKEEVIEIKTDYKILLWILIGLAVLIFLCHYLFSKEVSIKKRVFKVKHDDEQEEVELKVLLSVKNKRDKEVKDVRVIDLVPNLIIPTKEYGTLKPDRVQRGSRGLRLIWEIPSLEPGEERLIAYKVRSKLKVVGSIEFPPASVQYTNVKGAIVNSVSNSAKGSE
jgi:hypothetical protein